jgi:hypothetical protein
VKGVFMEDDFLPDIRRFVTKDAFFLFADIRGFTNWSRKYQLDVKKLVKYTYELAYLYFGAPRKQILLSRVVKFIGDGFLQYESIQMKDLN